MSNEDITEDPVMICSREVPISLSLKGKEDL
jgi:hypothetical protein